MKNRWPWLALAGVLALYLLVKLFALRPVIGDENIYFYQAWRISAGLWPYRDFVSAHPPLHLHSLALVAALTQGAFLALKAAPMLFTLGSGLCLWASVRTPRMRQWLPGQWWAVVVLALFLLSFDTLRVSSRATGTNQATFFLVLGFLCWLRDRPHWAGFCYGLAAGTAYYVAPVLLCLLAMGWTGRRGTVGQPAGRALLASLVLTLVAVHAPLGGWRPVLGGSRRSAFTWPNPRSGPVLAPLCVSSWPPRVSRRWPASWSGAGCWAIASAGHWPGWHWPVWRPCWPARP